MLAVERAYERGIDTGDKREFMAAFEALRDFRLANLEYDKTCFAGLAGDEKTWEKASK